MSEGSSKQLIRKVLSRNIDLLALHYCKKMLTGYDLIQQIEKAFGVRLGAGVVYNSLMRLERDKLLSHQFVDGKRGTRKACSYIVTEKSRAYLAEGIQVLRFLCQVFL